MDDTDKKIGPRLPLLFKMHEIWSAESQKNCCHQMSDFKAKMHPKFDFGCVSKKFSFFS